MRLFIERIEVGEHATIYSRCSGQSICIVYRDMDAIDYIEEQEAEGQKADERQAVELRAQEEAEEKTA